MKMVNAFKNLIAVDVLSGDCKLVVNGFVAKKVTFTKIQSQNFFSMVRKLRAYVLLPAQNSILRQLF